MWYPRFLERVLLQYCEETFKNFLQKNIATFSQKKRNIFSTFTNDRITIQDQYLKNLFHFIQMLIFLVGSLSLLLFYSPGLTIIEIILSFSPFVILVVIGKKLAEMEKKESDSNEVYVSIVKDILAGFTVIKTVQSESDVQR